MKTYNHINENGETIKVTIPKNEDSCIKIGEFYDHKMGTNFVNELNNLLVDPKRKYKIITDYQAVLAPVGGYFEVWLNKKYMEVK
jgi:hypothetical protein